MLLNLIKAIPDVASYSDRIRKIGLVDRMAVLQDFVGNNDLKPRLAQRQVANTTRGKEANCCVCLIHTKTIVYHSTTIKDISGDLKPE